jgi:hypothetical protein
METGGSRLKNRSQFCAVEESFLSTKKPVKTNIFEKKDVNGHLPNRREILWADGSDEAVKLFLLVRGGTGLR